MFIMPAEAHDTVCANRWSCHLESGAAICLAGSAGACYLCERVMLYNNRICAMLEMHGPNAYMIL